MIQAGNITILKEEHMVPQKTALNAYTIALAFELRDTAFKINAVESWLYRYGLQSIQRNRNIHDAAARIVKYATMMKTDQPGCILVMIIIRRLE